MSKVRDKGLTVVTVASDSQSVFPPLCQILRTTCCGPTCCSGMRGLMQPSVAAALGTIQIMVGLFSVGLGPGRTSLRPGDLAGLGVSYWLGGVYITAGLMAVLAGRCPSLCLVGLAVFMNITGALLSIVGVVLYALDVADTSTDRICSWGWDDNIGNDDNCEFAAYIFRRLLTAMDITMIVLAVLQLCVCISFAVLGIRAMVSRSKREDDKEVQIYQPLLKEVLMTSPSHPNTA